MKFLKYELAIRKGGLPLTILMVALLSALTVGLLLGGCLGDKNNPKKPRAFIVLIDETNTFGNERIPDVVLRRVPSLRNLWELSVSEIAQYIVGRMGPDEGFLLIGIDTYGWDENDVRAGPKVLSSGLISRTERSELGRMVIDLKNQRRSCEGDADIPGAISFAHHYMRNFPTHRIVIVVFSVMSNTNFDLIPLRDKSFPGDTEVHCFNVVAKGEPRWVGTVQNWMDVFRMIGISKIGKDNFWSVTETLPKLNELFPKQ